jgi:hypothetical protein
VIIQVDCLELVDFWSSRNNTRSVAAPILQELEDIVPSYTSFSVTHVGRNLNSPAQQCANHACTPEGTESWFDRSPDFLIQQPSGQIVTTFDTLIKLLVRCKKKKKNDALC